MTQTNERAAVAAWARQLLQQEFLILDLETTGLNPRHDQIVQIGIIDQIGQVVLHQTINPGVPIPPQASATCLRATHRQAHGITDEAVGDAPPWETLLPQVTAVLQGQVVGVYNLPFDRSFLAANGVRVAGIRWLPCLMRQYARYWGAWHPWHQSYTWQRLTVACHQQGIVTHDAHDALADCRMALALLRAMGRDNA
jgi:DNA polymerase III subunit epsilon